MHADTEEYRGGYDIFWIRLLANMGLMGHSQMLQPHLYSETLSNRGIDRCPMTDLQRTFGVWDLQRVTQMAYRHLLV